MFPNHKAAAVRTPSTNVAAIAPIGGSECDEVAAETSEVGNYLVDVWDVFRADGGGSSCGSWVRGGHFEDGS